jgi:hypothetical protein
MSNKALDAAARQKGFPDYATYKAWEAKRTGSLRTKGTTKAAPQKNWLQKLGMMHPANTLDYVAKKFKAATSRGSSDD